MTPRARGSSTRPRRWRRGAAGDIFSDFQLPTSDWDDQLDVSRVSRVSRWAARQKLPRRRRLADAESRALRAHALRRVRSAGTVPREALFSPKRVARRETRFLFFTRSRGRPREGGAEARARRAAAAHALGMGPPVGRAPPRPPGVPWTRGWRDGGWTRVRGPFAGGFVSGLETNTLVARRDSTRTTRTKTKTTMASRWSISRRAGTTRARGAALGAARSGGAWPATVSRMPRPAEASRARRRGTSRLRAETVTCANETGGMYTDDGTDTEKSRNLSGRSLVSAEQKNV